MWVHDLRIGERLQTAEGAVSVEALEKVRGLHRVYNLEVRAHNNCFTVRDAAGRLRNRLTGEFVSQRTADTAQHIFGPKSLGKHGLQGVLDSFGGNGIKATRALQRAAQSAVDRGVISDVFETVVEVGGLNITIRGRVMDGVAKLRTAFIPNP